VGIVILKRSFCERITYLDKWRKQHQNVSWFVTTEPGFFSFPSSRITFLNPHQSAAFCQGKNKIKIIEGDENIFLGCFREIKKNINLSILRVT
jgi:hypothetical protein